jgi:hypothetical protein
MYICPAVVFLADNPVFRKFLLDDLAKPGLYFPIGYCYGTTIRLVKDVQRSSEMP